MASASFVEIISHFAGYLQIFHDIARDRLQYDESLAPRSVPATTRRLDRITTIAFTPDDMDTVGGSGAGADAGRCDGRVPRPSAQAVRGPRNADYDFFPPSLNPKVPLPVAGGGGGGGGELTNQGDIPGWWPGDPTDGSSIQLHA